MRKRLSLLLLLAVMAVGQSFAINLFIGGEEISSGDFTDIKSEHAKAYNSELGSYKMWMDKTVVDGDDVYTLHLQNVQIFNTSGSSGIDFLVWYNERVVIVVESTSKVMAQSNALMVSSDNPTTDLTIQGSYPLILKSLDSDALYLHNYNNGCNLYLDGYLEVSNTSNSAEDMRAAILFKKPGDIHLTASGYLKAKSNYAGIVGVKKLTYPGTMNTNFEFAYFDEDGEYASVDPSAKDKRMTSWCYANYYEVPVKVAGSQVLSAHSWGEAGVESPYITKGAVKYNDNWGCHNIYLEAAEINIPEEVTDVPGILFTGGSVRVVQTLADGSDGNVSRINVPGGDGIRFAGSPSYPIDYIEITQDMPAYLQYLIINAKTGINVQNLTGTNLNAEITQTLKLTINAETGIYFWGNENTSFYYNGQSSSEVNVRTTGKGMVFGNDNGTGTEAYFRGEGRFKIVADGDGLAVYDATVHFDESVYVSVESREGAAINGNKSNSHIRKESKDSYVWLHGKTGDINDVFFLIFADGAGEIVQNDEADDARMEKLNAPFQTLVKNGKPYTDVAELRFVEKFFQIGDFVLGDNNISYFEKKIPGVSWDSSNKELHLKDAKIKATGENIGLMPLFDSFDANIILEGDNVIEAEAVALQNDKCIMHIVSQDGKGKLTLKSTKDKGIYALNNKGIYFSDITLDVTAEKQAFYNEDVDTYFSDCVATLTGNGGGYFGAQYNAIIQLDNSFLTCTGSESGGKVNPSFWGYNNPCMGSVELLTSGYAFEYAYSPEVWVYKTATGAKTGETIQFGVQPDNLYYQIEVNGISLTAANCSSIKPAEMKSGKISYDPVERELTLDNVVMDEAYIYIGYLSKCNKVKLVGENTINGTLYGALFENNTPVTIYSEDGNGKLTYKGNGTGISMYSKLAIKNCEVDLTSESNVGLDAHGQALTIEKAVASFCGKIASVAGVSDLTTDWETSIIAPEGAEWNYSSQYVEVDGNPVVDQPVIFRYVKHYYVWIGSQMMTEDDLGGFKTAAGSSGKVSYDPEKNVLTLDNASINEVLQVQVEDPITIMLVGKNKIKTNYNGFRVEKAATITSADGKGELNVLSESTAIESDDDLTIENCKVTATVTGSWGLGIHLYYGALTVNNATVRAEGMPSIHVANGLELGEGMEITEPEYALYNKITGDVEVNGLATDYEVTISKPAVMATTVPVKVSTVGAAGFSSNKSLDFTGLPVSAWISTGMRDGNIMLSRVNKVAAGTGVYLKGTKGKEVECNVPIIQDDSYYANMFVGVPAGKKIDEKEGPIMIPDYYKTYFFAKSTSTGEPTFYPTEPAGKELGANKMYMKMPASVKPDDMGGAIEEETVEVTVGTAGAAGFSCDKALDFTGSEISAWVATGFSDGNIMLSRVYAVPANTGLYLKGKAGQKITDKIHVTQEKPFYMNLFRPTGTSPITVSPYETELETGIQMSTLYFAMSKSTGAPTFYPTEAPGKELGANKMYLCIPASLVPAPSRTIGLQFLDDDVIETTGISEFNADENGEAIMANRNGVYDLQGRRVDASMVKKGVYIQNGRKVFKK